MMYLKETYIKIAFVVILFASCYPKIHVNGQLINNATVISKNEALDSNEWETVKQHKWHPYFIKSKYGKFNLNHNDSDWFQIVNDSIVAYKHSKDSNVVFQKYETDTLVNIDKFYIDYGIRLSPYFVYSPQKFILKRQFDFYSVNVKKIKKDCLIIECRISKANTRKRKKVYLGMMKVKQPE